MGNKGPFAHLNTVYFKGFSLLAVWRVASEVLCFPEAFLLVTGTSFIL
jgi:hypothetical protein